MAFLTARNPSLMASLICVMVCWLGPFTSRVTERGFPHFSMKVYFSSPCKQGQEKWPNTSKRIKDSATQSTSHNRNSKAKTKTHQCVFIDQPSISQALGCEVINGIHGNAPTCQCESTENTEHCILDKINKNNTQNEYIKGLFWSSEYMQERQRLSECRGNDQSHCSTDMRDQGEPPQRPRVFAVQTDDSISC